MSNPYKPWRAVIVGIDPGAVSGISVWQCGYYISSDKVRTAKQRYDQIVHAYSCAQALGLPLIFIAEDWPSSYLPDRRRMSNASVRGMGMNWGKWLQEIEKLPKPKGLPKIKVLRVPVMTWRSKMDLGGMDKETAKRKAITLCQCADSMNIWDHNEAEAYLIGKFGCYWPKLEKIKGLERCE